MQNLKHRWMNLWRDIGTCAETGVAEYYGLIEKMYADPLRYYHDLEGHIRHCLLEFDQARHLAENPCEVEVALWLHDVIYDTHSDHNELRSALFAANLCYVMGAGSDFCRRVTGFIEATDHKLDPLNSDTKLVVDIDLSSLGANPDIFNQNSRNIRQEYIWVPKDVFLAKRAQLFRGFFERPYVYYTDFFRAKYEKQARENLERALTLHAWYI